ncbi:hypothetical protein LEP1GSC052_0477 [Leptospira kmetyi serovar Malaysia str. Bejo-Iso9]|nr:hypothetical protein LEP1GSC052_0477 [Leptospira kmetyi serovar Malaysia str. Bejo-Iso9]
MEISDEICTVLSLVEPPAPYVTVTKSGFKRDSSFTVSINLASPSGVFGGKNSNEYTGPFAEP